MFILVQSTLNERLSVSLVYTTHSNLTADCSLPGERLGAQTLRRLIAVESIISWGSSAWQSEGSTVATWLYTDTKQITNRHFEKLLFQQQPEPATANT